MNFQDSPLTFPCEFPIKVVGYAGDAFESAVIAIIERHAAGQEPPAITTRHSRKGNYSSITILLQAESRAQLDAIYQELTACKEVVMAL